MVYTERMIYHETVFAFLHHSCRAVLRLRTASAHHRRYSRHAICGVHRFAAPAIRILLDLSTYLCHTSRKAHISHNTANPALGELCGGALGAAGRK